MSQEPEIQQNRFIRKTLLLRPETNDRLKAYCRRVGMREHGAIERALTAFFEKEDSNEAVNPLAS